MGIWLTKNDVFISGVQQSDSDTHIHVSVLFQILFPLRLLQNIEQRSLCYTMHACSVTSVLSSSVQPCRLQLSRLLRPWDSPGKNTGVGCHFLFQRIFPTQGSNLGLLHCRQILYHLSVQGSPDTGGNYRQKEKRVAEDEMVG